MSGRPSAEPGDGRKDGLKMGVFFVGAIGFILLLKYLLGY